MPTEAGRLRVWDRPAEELLAYTQCCSSSKVWSKAEGGREAGASLLETYHGSHSYLLAVCSQQVIRSLLSFPSRMRQ